MTKLKHFRNKVENRSFYLEQNESWRKRKKNKKKNHQKRTIAGHEHIELKEEHRLHYFSSDLTVTETFAPLLNVTFSAKGEKTSHGSICLTKTSRVSDSHLNGKNPSRTGITTVVVFTAAGHPQPSQS